MKLCKDCKHVVIPSHLFGKSDLKNWTCGFLNNYMVSQLDGRTHPVDLAFCTEERAPTGDCGDDGKYFEVKDDV